MVGCPPVAFLQVLPWMVSSGYLNDLQNMKLFGGLPKLEKKCDHLSSLVVTVLFGLHVYQESTDR